MPEATRPRVLQMGPDVATGGGMAASIGSILDSSLADRYRLDVLPTYDGPQSLRRLLVFSRALFLLVAWSLSGRGRIVHVHATVRGSAYRKAAVVLLAKALRRRVVLHVHSGAGDIAAFRCRCSRPLLLFLGAALRAADVTLAVSAASVAALRQAGAPVAEIEIVPNCAPSIPAFERSETPGEVGIAYLGGFANPAKGGDVLLTALPAALRREQGLRVTLAGPGRPPPQGQELLGVEPRLSWAGWLEPGAKASLLRSAQIFVMPSRSEGMPMALLEAMAYGMAVIASEAGGIPELLDDEVEGLLVAPEQPGELADAICRLAADAKLRARLGAAARRRAGRQDAGEIAARLDTIYRALL